MNRDPIEHLLKEHKIIMAEIAELRTAVETLRVSSRADRGDEAVAETLPVFRRIGQMMASQLDLHRRKEDDVLFPEYEAALGLDGTPTSVMRQEHKDIHAQGVLLRETLHELNEVQHPAIEAGGEQLRALAAGGGSAEALRATGEEIIGLLDMHFTKEEEVLFPMTDDLLGAEALERVMDGFRKLEADTD